MHIVKTSNGHKHVESPQRKRWAAIGAACREMLDAVPAAAYICEGSGQITYFNPIAEAVWGRTPRLRDGGELYCGSHRLYSVDGVQIRHEECWMALALRRGGGCPARPHVRVWAEGGRPPRGEARPPPA